jgi:hypothetical protein
MVFGRFSAGPHRYDHPAIVGEILDSGGLAAIFVGLEPAEPPIWLVNVDALRPTFIATE